MEGDEGTGSFCNYSTMDGASTPCSWRGDVMVPELKCFALKNSSLGGITFVNAFGRFVCLYWQHESARIMESIYWQDEQRSWRLKQVNRVTEAGEQSEAQPLPGIPKLSTPLAAVSWTNGLKRWVFYLDGWNVIHEMITEDGGRTWQSGPLKNVRAFTRNNSSLAATIDQRYGVLPHVLIYYQNNDNKIKRFVFDANEERWSPCNAKGDQECLTGLAGTSIAALSNQLNSGEGEFAYFLDAKHNIEEFYFTQKWQEEVHTSHPISGTYDSCTTIATCGLTKSPQEFHVFVHNGRSVKRSTYCEGWNAQSQLRSREIGKRFVTLEWYEDEDDEEHPETHLFSISSSGYEILDYVVVLDGADQGCFRLPFC